MIHYKITLEPETTPVRGNIVCSDDPEQDRIVEDLILEDLEAGHLEVWCVVKVEAWLDPDFSIGPHGVAYLGACSFNRRVSRKEVLAHAEDHGLLLDAREDLEREINTIRMVIDTPLDDGHTIELA